MVTGTEVVKEETLDSLLYYLPDKKTFKSSLIPIIISD
jgi:hypothetical protein